MECHFTQTWDMDSFSPHFEDVREEQGVAQRLGYSGPNTLFFDCCFAAFHLWSCIVWHEQPIYDHGGLASYYKLSASPKLSKYHEPVLKRKVASRKWCPSKWSFSSCLQSLATIFGQFADQRSYTEKARSFLACFPSLQHPLQNAICAIWLP